MHQFIEFVIKHWMLWSALVVVSLAILIMEFTSRTRGVKQLSPQQVTSLINHDHAVVVDIRSETDFKQGHITGALHLPVASIQTERKKLEKFKNKPLILICENGEASAKVAHDLHQDAYAHVVTLKGGIKGWSEASLPLIQSK